MSRVYFSSTSYNCTEAVAISHTLRNDNKVEEKNGWRPWRVNVFFSPCAFANFLLFKKKIKLEKDAYLVLLKKDSHFVYDGRMYFLTNNASFFFLTICQIYPHDHF